MKNLTHEEAKELRENLPGAPYSDEEGGDLCQELKEKGLLEHAAIDDEPDYYVFMTTKRGMRALRIYDALQRFG